MRIKPNGDTIAADWDDSEVISYNVADRQGKTNTLVGALQTTGSNITRFDVYPSA